MLRRMLSLSLLGVLIAGGATIAYGSATKGMITTLTSFSSNHDDDDHHGEDRHDRRHH